MLISDNHDGGRDHYAWVEDFSKAWIRERVDARSF